MIENNKHSSTQKKNDEDMAGLDRAISNRHVKRAILYIKENYTKSNLTRGNVATAIGVDAHWLSRLFKRETGMTVGEYITLRRIMKAEILLKTTDHKIKDVAIMVGYEDSYYFSKKFKQLNLITPLEYRNLFITKLRTKKEELEVE